MKINKIVLVLFWTAIVLLKLLYNPPLSYASYQELGKAELLGPVGQTSAQYSPWVMHNPGWGAYVMYYCKGSPINGVQQDRVWRVANWNDGKSGDWVDDRVVIEGTIGQNDDLSCSPGVLIDNQDKWHMYYVTANRDTGCDVYLYHAVADAPGVTWTKMGVININGAPMEPVPVCAVETPSTYYINGKYVVYYSGTPGKLVRIESTDGHNFTGQTTINLPDPVSNAGRLIIVNGQYYYIYGRNPSSGYLPPTQILITQSSDGVNFSTPELLMTSSGSGWDGDKMWHPYAMISDNELRAYYAGNIGTYGWWGSNSSIGVRWFSLPTATPTITSTPTSTPSPKPGDLNGDNKVDIFDYNILVGDFGKTGDNGWIPADIDKNGIVNIFDYNILVEYFGT